MAKVLLFIITDKVRAKGEGSSAYFCHSLDPFLKYLSDFQNSDEMAMRIEEAFNLFDYNNNGFVEVKVGLERHKLLSR